MTGFAVSLPFPDKRLSPNGRHHYLVRAAAFQEAKDVAVVSIRAGQATDSWSESVGIIAHFRCPDKRRRDLDNLFAMCKPYIDALVHCQIIADDNLIIEALLRKCIDVTNPGVTLEVYPCLSGVVPHHRSPA